MEGAIAEDSGVEIGVALASGERDEVELDHREEEAREEPAIRIAKILRGPSAELASNLPSHESYRTCVVYPCLSSSSDDHPLLHSCLGTGMRFGIITIFCHYRSSLVHLPLSLVCCCRWCEQYHDTAISGIDILTFATVTTFVQCVLVYTLQYHDTANLVHDSGTEDPQLVAERGEYTYATMRDAKLVESRYDKVVMWTGGSYDYDDVMRALVRLDRPGIRPGTSGQNCKTFPTYFTDPEVDAPTVVPVSESCTPPSMDGPHWNEAVDAMLEDADFL